ncbi:MAG: hypothetical protein ABN482_09750 [Corticimicrobacter sp.]|uniref:hypothetical protein n=1 Tax=Corticimicrobacter sp. TaxID=2678536 RepID=UPI0032DB468C
MEKITQMLMNNAGQRLTVELINGMNHTIKTEFDSLAVQNCELQERIDALIAGQPQEKQ